MRMKEKDTELNECKKEAAINKEDIKCYELYLRK